MTCHRPRSALFIATLAVVLFGVAFAQDASPLVIVTDVVAGHENNTPEGTCVPTNRFSADQQVIWRTKVIDPTTGEAMDDAALESVSIVLPDGERFTMSYGGHPGREPVDYYWTYDWVVPVGYPTGLLDFDVEAVANDGRTGRLVMFPIETSMLTIVPQ